ncbi:histidine N-alpha-methyltransferase-like [Saccoglossus kowalevskii]|uniref:Histidine-specific methyltransferase bacterial-like 161 n=1 Tax=Saccoglossus kowalevskii TaxID=10224 RepID=A0A0U2IDP7_SACKO|nr:PREDICTED: uncharacterized protein LOC100369148 [Saccoglossus kowalevskii]ALR88596.1 histidine-specific methyltransferase bacterial-like 161 [Saccoglossus kowalevskii]
MEIEHKAVRKWLLSTPKYVPMWYLYDTIGSVLYEKITMENPHYHIYRTESHILKQNADEIISGLKDIVLCELGAGNATKTAFLISALLKKNKMLTYIPIDVAKDFMEHNVSLLMQRFSEGLEAKSFAGDYVDGLHHLKGLHRNKLIMWIGNSISNVPIDDLKSLLAQINNIMGENDRFLVGIDLTQDKDKALTIYSHPDTWIPFKMNALTRLNRDLGANFKHQNFKLYTKYVRNDDVDGFVEKPQYIQHALKSICEQHVRLDALDLKLHFEAGELFFCHELEHLSLKWAWKQFEDTMIKGGFSLEKKWSDDCESYGVALLKKL